MTASIASATGKIKKSLILLKLIHMDILRIYLDAKIRKK